MFVVYRAHTHMAGMRVRFASYFIGMFDDNGPQNMSRKNKKRK